MIPNTYLREKLGVNFSVSVLDDLISRIKRIGKMLRGNNPLKNCHGDRNECARDMLFLAYLLYLTGLAWEKKFPALSTQIYYRAIEMALQSYLLSKGLWIGGETPLKELEKLDLPESLFKEFANRVRKDREEKEGVPSIKLGLKDNAEIINALAGGFPNFEKLDDYTQARNTSILAHGLYRPRPGDKLFGMLRRYVPCVIGYIAELLSTNFDMLREEAQPIEVILGVKGRILHAETASCN